MQLGQQESYWLADVLVISFRELWVQTRQLKNLDITCKCLGAWHKLRKPGSSRLMDGWCGSASLSAGETLRPEHHLRMPKRMQKSTGVWLQKQQHVGSWEKNRPGSPQKCTQAQEQRRLIELLSRSYVNTGTLIASQVNCE